jgi:hypothetical protein
MIRVNIIVEGHSEEQFVRDILSEHLAQRAIYVCARRVKTGRKSGKDYRGGVTTYAKIKNDVLRWLAEDSGAYLSTFFDLYRLPNDFPQFKEAQKKPEPLQRVNCLDTKPIIHLHKKNRWVSLSLFP